MHIANHDLPFGGVGASGMGSRDAEIGRDTPELTRARPRPGASGMGSYHAHRSFLAFTHEKAASSRLSPPPLCGAPPASLLSLPV